MKPIIGITVDQDPRSNRYNLRANYANALALAGGVSLLLPYNTQDIGAYMTLCHGFIFTGGKLDIDPTVYGEADIHPTVDIKPERTNFEKVLMKEALQRKKPILGICAGAQLLNVTLGGSLFQHIPAQIPQACLHIQAKEEDSLPMHGIEVLPQTGLSALWPTTRTEVNSSHHQAIKKLGEGVIVSSVCAEDGVVESIEVTNQPFCWGVQWHPEYLSCPHDILLFKALVEACTSN